MHHQPTDLYTTLTQAVAQRHLPDDLIQELAQRFTEFRTPIKGINVCERGICIDFVVDRTEWPQSMEDIVRVLGPDLRGVDVFPWGIPAPDLLHIRAVQGVALPGLGAPER